ncbi:MAG: dockerin type I domain-containing protein [Prevotellaceae bacterium]|nr:dockerin type I domain-containing protein [Prevotellaceae bacterium]
MKKLYFILLAMVFVCSNAYAEDAPAFPGAEGFGRYVTGGRGGTLYHVTNLNDSGTGSLRAGIEKSGKRIIVFDVSGTIYLKSALAIKNGNITIAGQTAPGDGICVADYPFTISADNVIIRFMRFRLGNRQVANHEGDGLGSLDRSRIMVDHCSVSWSIDECLSLCGVRQSTAQWCLVAQSLVNAGHSKGAHGYGGNWGGAKVSYHHNLLMHHSSRVPRLGPRYTTQLEELMDMRCNVFYNWGGEGCYGGEAQDVNIVNNYYKPGPTTATLSKAKQLRMACVGIRTNSYIKSYPDYAPTLHKWGHFFVEGNVNPDNESVTKDNWIYGIYNQISSSKNDGLFTQTTKDTMRLHEPLEYLPTTTHTAEKAYEKVLQYAGASLSRDSYDEIMVADAESGEATYTGEGLTPGLINNQDDCGGWPTLKTSSRKKDSDNDGIPDDWETANGMNPYSAADSKNYTIDSEKKYYTNIEVYLNWLVEDIMKAENADGIDTFEEYYPAVNDPSKALLGDANCDNAIDVADISTIAAFILGLSPNPWNLANADIDKDGEITVTDITGLAAIILGK